MQPKGDEAPAGHLVENALVKVPVEEALRAVKAGSKSVEKEVATLQAALSGLLSLDPAKGGREATIAELTRLAGKLQGLKRKLETHHSAEEDALRRAHARVVVMGENDDGRGRRLVRLMVDHMAREGNMAAAEKLAKECGVLDHCDLRLFVETRLITSALAQGDCGPALKWCGENRSRLKKVKSDVEVRIRIQEFIELVKSSRVDEAVGLARMHLAPSAATHLCEIKRCMAALAFRGDARVKRYADLFDDARRRSLVQEFKLSEYKVNSLSSRSALTVVLQAGLSCMKCSQCTDVAVGGGGWSNQQRGSQNCPVCTPLLRQLAEPLPPAHHVRSSLVCFMTGQVMDDDNPPIALPNGHVYSTRAIGEIVANHAGDDIVCPRTGEVFSRSELRKVYIS